jgi:cell division protein FtsZ
MTFNIVQNHDELAKIRVIGVGGAGGNAVNNMIEANLQGVKFIVANTDAQALETSQAQERIQIGTELTQGLGAGANPEVGKGAALEDKEAIRAALEGSNMVFITAGFGGGTGTGAAPVIAEICKELEILTVAVVTKPFSFEGRRRTDLAQGGIESLKEMADTVITIPNDRLRGLAPKNAKMIDMFKRADEILLHSVKGITDLIMVPGLINLDFADVQTTMAKAGMAIMGIGIASGDNRAIEAAEKAISHPLLEDCSVSGAKGVLINITASNDLTMEEMADASERIHDEVGDEADIIWGAVLDDTVGDEMRVTVIATGFGDECKRQETPKPTMVKPKVIEQEKIEPRGKLRDVTPDDIRQAKMFTEPTFIPRESPTDEASSGGRETKHLGLIIDGEDLDVPTFMRKKAQ